MYRICCVLIAYCLIALAVLEAHPAEILILRNAEKAEKAEEGTGLSTRGRERAAALVPFLTETTTLLANGEPAAIYAVAPASGETASLSMATVSGFADKQKLTVISKFGKDDYKKMVEEIKSDAAYTGKTVMICWDATVIPEIARAFGALQTPARWPSETYDRVWMITFSATGKATFQNVPQRLMYGDSPR